MINFIKSSEIKKNLGENKIIQMKEAALKEIKECFNKNSSRFCKKNYHNFN